MDLFVGKKPFGNYMVAINFFVQNPDERRLIVRARGNAIIKALNLGEWSKRYFDLKMPVDAENFVLGSEEKEVGEKKEKVWVTTLEFTLKKD